MDPAAVAGEVVAEQAAFPAAAVVAGAPVPESAVAGVVANEETGEARISTHVVPMAASTVARGATEWLVPGVVASSAAAAVAAASAVIRRTHRRATLAATYPAAVHHLRVLIT